MLLFMKDKKNLWNSLKLATELGYTIAIPIVVMGLLGRFIDKKFDTSPIFLIVGILASIAVSSIAIYYKTIKILKQFDVEENQVKDSEKKL